MMLPPNILGICLCAIVLTCKLPAGQLSSVDNPFCPREGYAVSDVSITPGDNIFIKCEQLMSEFQKVRIFRGKV